MSITDQAAKDFKAVLTSPIFQADSLDNASEKIEAYACLDVLEKACSAAKKQLYKDIEDAVDSAGDSTEGGHKEVTLGEITMTRQKRIGKQPNTDSVKALLAEKNITIDKVFDEVKSLVYNPSRVSSLVERGFLEEAEIESLREVKYALVTSVSRKLKDKLTKHDRGTA